MTITLLWGFCVLAVAWLVTMSTKKSFLPTQSHPIRPAEESDLVVEHAGDLAFTLPGLARRLRGHPIVAATTTPTSAWTLRFADGTLLSLAGFDDRSKHLPSGLSHLSAGRLSLGSLRLCGPDRVRIDVLDGSRRWVLSATSLRVHDATLPGSRADR